MKMSPYISRRRVRKCSSGAESRQTLNKNHTKSALLPVVIHYFSEEQIFDIGPRIWDKAQHPLKQTITTVTASNWLQHLAVLKDKTALERDLFQGKETNKRHLTARFMGVRDGSLRWLFSSRGLQKRQIRTEGQGGGSALAHQPPSLPNIWRRLRAQPSDRAVGRWRLGNAEWKSRSMAPCTCLLNRRYWGLKLWRDSLVWD